MCWSSSYTQVGASILTPIQVLSPVEGSKICCDTRCSSVGSHEHVLCLPRGTGIVGEGGSLLLPRSPHLFLKFDILAKQSTHPEQLSGASFASHKNVDRDDLQHSTRALILSQIICLHSCLVASSLEKIIDHPAPGNTSIVVRSVSDPRSSHTPPMVLVAWKFSRYSMLDRKTFAQLSVLKTQMNVHTVIKNKIK